MQGYAKSQQHNSSNIVNSMNLSNASTSSTNRFQNQTQLPYFRRVLQQNHPSSSQNYSNQHNYHSSNTAMNSHASTSLSTDNPLVHPHHNQHDQRVEFHHRPHHNNQQHHDGFILNHSQQINNNSQSAYRQEVMPPSVLGSILKVLFK